MPHVQCRQSKWGCLVSYRIYEYEFSEPAFTGKVRSAMCDSHRDIVAAVDEYYVAEGPLHYLVLTPALSEEFEGWVKAFRVLIWKQQINRIPNIVASATLIGIPWALVTTKLFFDAIDAKAQERRGFYTCYIASNYKYKDGYVGVNLSTPSPAGCRLLNGKAPL